MTALLEMRGVSKSFAGVQALRDVNFTVEAGQVHALVGENGAGKSTLMKVLSGVYPHVGIPDRFDLFDSKAQRQSIKLRKQFVHQANQIGRRKP